MLENLGDNDTIIGGTLPQRMVSCLQTIDVLMQQPHPVLASMVVAEKRKADTSGSVSLISCVANILGLKDVKNVNDSSSLADLGMDSLMGAEIKQTLERNFDLVMSAQEIRQLTFGKIRSFENGEDSITTPVTSRVSSPVNGQQSPTPHDMERNNNMIQFTKELMPTQCLLKMKSNENAKNQKSPIFFIHPIEGVVSAMTHLAEAMNRPVYGLQCVSYAPLDTIEELAAYYIKQIRSVQTIGPYTIVGYSFGGCVAFEMVTQLERDGNEKCRLIMIDSSPNYVSWYTEAQLARNAKGRSPTGQNPSKDEAYAFAYFGMVCGQLDYKLVRKLIFCSSNQYTYYLKLLRLLSNWKNCPLLK